MNDPRVYADEVQCNVCHGTGRLVLDDHHPENWHECPACATTE